MLYCLNIENDSKKRFFGKNEVRLHEKQDGLLCIKYINVKIAKGKIPWKKISKLLGNYNKILCAENVNIPQNCRIFKYKSDRLNVFLAKNSAKHVLKTMQTDRSNFKIALYDPEGNHISFLHEIVEFSSRILVVSDKKMLYENAGCHLMEKHGASILVTSNRNWLYNCDFVIAPEKIVEPLQLPFNTVLFTGAKSCCALNGIVYDDYKIKSFVQYDNLRPSNLTKEYFLGAIYEEYKFKELEEIVPEKCCHCEQEISLDFVAKSINKQKLISI